MTRFSRKEEMQGRGQFSSLPRGCLFIIGMSYIFERFRIFQQSNALAGD